MTMDVFLDPLKPGSIKDQVAEAVHVLGDHATRSRIRGVVSCDASILEIAIDSMERAGYLIVHEDGYYVLCEQLSREYLHVSMPIASQAVNVEPVADSALPADDTADATDALEQLPNELMQICVGRYACGKRKATGEFTGDDKTCKSCRQIRQTEVQRERRRGALRWSGTHPGAASKAAEPKVVVNNIVMPEPVEVLTRDPQALPVIKFPELTNKLVIPASGEVTCELHESGYTVSIKQHNQTLVITLDQLFAICTWGRDVVVAKSNP